MSVNLKPLIIVAVLVLIVLGIVAFISLSGTSKPGTNTSNNTVAVITPKPLVEVNDIVVDPIVYDELNVEVESQVIEWVTKKSFKVTTSGGGVFGGGGKPLLVIGKKPFALPQNGSLNKLGLGEKVRIHIKGRVAIINKDQLENDLGVDFKSPEFTLDNNNLTSWILGPVLLLDSVEKL